VVGRPLGFGLGLADGGAEIVGAPDGRAAVVGGRERAVGRAVGAASGVADGAQVGRCVGAMVGNGAEGSSVDGRLVGVADGRGVGRNFVGASVLVVGGYDGAADGA
jgi:hypothetical protein